MAKVTIPNIAKGKMADARAGKAALPAITMIAFGDGGVGDDGAALTPLSTMTALNHEILRKTVSTVEKVGTMSYKYGYTLAEGELDGKSVSEVALIDEDGDLAAVEFFKARADDLDSTYYMIDDFA